MYKCIECEHCEKYSGDLPCRNCRDFDNFKHKQVYQLLDWLTAHTDTIETQAGVKMNVIDADELMKFIENNPK